MPLIIEDGTGVAGANSYATLAEQRAYAFSLGVTLSSDDDVVTVQSNKAIAYMESFRSKYKGELVERDQSLSFPRKYVYVDGFYYAPTELPPQVKRAQMQLVVEVHNGVVLMPTLQSTAGGQLKRKKIGPLEKEYFSSSATDQFPLMSSMEALLGPLLNSGYGGFGKFMTHRV